MSEMGLSRFGLSNSFLSSLMEQYCLWEDSLETLVKTASKSGSPARWKEFIKTYV